LGVANAKQSEQKCHLLLLLHLIVEGSDHGMHIIILHNCKKKTPWHSKDRKNFNKIFNLLFQPWKIKD
jgi:hypothetical protein